MKPAERPPIFTPVRVALIVTYVFALVVVLQDLLITRPH